MKLLFVDEMKFHFLPTGRVVTCSLKCSAAYPDDILSALTHPHFAARLAQDFELPGMETLLEQMPYCSESGTSPVPVSPLREQSASYRSPSP
jgi:hypothetical protein